MNHQETAGSAFAGDTQASASVGTTSSGIIDYPVTGGTIQFNLNTGEIISSDKTITAVRIPGEIEGSHVKSIAYRAFRDCRELQTAVIDEGLKKIGYKAFDNCVSLERIEIPSSVSETGVYNFLNVGNWFNGCGNLEKVVLKEGMTTIPKAAFAGIPNEVELRLPESIRTIQANAFKGCRIKNFVFPERLEAIGDSAFANHSYKAIVTRDHVRAGENGVLILPSLNLSFGTSVFANGYELEEVEWPGEQAIMPTRAFSGCGKLRKVIMTEGLVSIGYKAFDNCAGLETIEIPSSVSETGVYDYLYVGNWFNGCGSLKKVILNEGMTIIPKAAFAGIPKEVELRLPESIRTIQVNAFNGSRMKGFVLPEQIEVIEDSALANHGYQAIVTRNHEKAGEEGVLILPSRNLSLGMSVFANGKELEEVEWPKEQVRLPNRGFSGCGNLKKVTLSEGLVRIGYKAFDSCASLETIEIPSSVSETGVYDYLYVGNWFNGCSSLKKVILNEGMTIIPKAAFAGIPNEVELRLPESIYTIQVNAFKGSHMKGFVLPNQIEVIEEGALANHSYKAIVTRNHEKAGEEGVLILPSRNLSLGMSVFANGNELEEVEWPKEQSILPNRAFDGCGKLKKATLPEGLVRVGYKAFENCVSLEKVEIPSSVSETGVYDYLYAGNWFHGCSGLKTVGLAEGMSVIPKGAFAGIPTDVLINIPASITGIEEEAFSGSGITSIGGYVINPAGEHKPISDITLGQRLFKNCKNLKRVEWPDYYPTIPNEAFMYCTELEEVTFSPNLKGIGYRAFHGCTNLKSVEIPESVTEAGSSNGRDENTGRWFEGCSSLNQITLEEEAVCIPTGAFAGIPNDFKIQIPGSVKRIGAHAFHNCVNLTSLLLPESIEEIGLDAFKGCNRLNR